MNAYHNQICIVMGEKNSIPSEVRGSFTLRTAQPTEQNRDKRIISLVFANLKPRFFRQITMINPMMVRDFKGFV